MEKLGTLESEVLSHEVVDGRVKVVVRTVPGMKLPRVVRPVLRGKEVEFVDTRTFLQRDKGKLPFAQTFRTVNNITERASVAGTIVIDRAPVPVSQNTSGDGRNTSSGAMMMGTVIRVQGECVVRIAGLGGKVESVIVQNLRNAYKKLPEIVHEWVATRETRLTEFGFAGGIPGGIQRSPSLSATSIETVVETTNSGTSPRLIRAASVESEGSDLSSASFHSADSFQIENESARDDGREEGWGGRGGDARPLGAASNGSSERYPQTPSFAATRRPPLPPPRGAANEAGATPVGSLLSPHAFESDSPLETPEFFRASPGGASRALTGPSGAFLSPVHGMDTRQIQEREERRDVDGEGDIDSADERTSRALHGRSSRERRSANASNNARLGSGLPLDSSDSLGDGLSAGLEQGRGKKGGSLSAVARWCCCAPGQPGSPLLDDIAESPAASDDSLRSLSSSPGADDAADANAWSPADDADLRTPLTPGTKTKRRSRR